MNPIEPATTRNAAAATPTFIHVRPVFRRIEPCSVTRWRRIRSRDATSSRSLSRSLEEVDVGVHVSLSVIGSVASVTGSVAGCSPRSWSTTPSRRRPRLTRWRALSSVQDRRRATSEYDSCSITRYCKASRWSSRSDAIASAIAPRIGAKSTRSSIRS